MVLIRTRRPVDTIRTLRCGRHSSPGVTHGASVCPSPILAVRSSFDRVQTVRIRILTKNRVPHPPWPPATRSPSSYRRRLRARVQTARSARRPPQSTRHRAIRANALPRQPAGPVVACPVKPRKRLGIGLARHRSLSSTFIEMALWLRVRFGHGPINRIERGHQADPHPRNNPSRILAPRWASSSVHRRRTILIPVVGRGLWWRKSAHAGRDSLTDHTPIVGVGRHVGIDHVTTTALIAEAIAGFQHRPTRRRTPE